jgi:hypothetical protein
LADTVTVFTDTTNIISFNGSSGTTYSGPGFNGANPSQGDYLGSDFNTTGLTVTVSSDTIKLEYATTFSGTDSGGATAKYADIFVAPASSLTSGVADGGWTYGVALGAQGEPAGLYALATGDYQTSEQIWASQTGWIYGGEYIGPDGVARYSPTRITGGTLIAEADPTFTDLGGGNYLVDVVIHAPSGGLDSLISPDLDIFWGTGDCSNDALFAALDAPVPEPVSLSLFGAGLAGAAAWRRKKKQS